MPDCSGLEAVIKAKPYNDGKAGKLNLPMRGLPQIGCWRNERLTAAQSADWTLKRRLAVILAMAAVF